LCVTVASVFSEEICTTSDHKFTVDVDFFASELGKFFRFWRIIFGLQLGLSLHNLVLNL
jgi:hypothetical protein